MPSVKLSVVSSKTTSKPKLDEYDLVPEGYEYERICLATICHDEPDWVRDNLSEDYDLSSIQHLLDDYYDDDDIFLELDDDSIF